MQGLLLMKAQDIPKRPLPPKKGSLGRGRATVWQPLASSRMAQDLFSGSELFFPPGRNPASLVRSWIGDQAHRSKDAVAQLA